MVYVQTDFSIVMVMLLVPWSLDKLRKATLAFKTLITMTVVVRAAISSFGKEF
jgi:hypothetical protein